jgi:murein DD-endopeptidase MepM/ murein hydrolase activator NlpD
MTFRPCYAQAHSRMILAVALALLLVLLAACDSAPAPQVSTPSAGDPTTTPSALETATSEVQVVPSATVEVVVATPEVVPTLPPPSSPTPSPTETAQADMTATSTTEATATAKITATSARPKPTATSGETETPGPLTYFFPVEPSGVTSYGAAHHDYPATDIFCPIGSRFVAPIDGVVEYVSYEDPWEPSVDDPATRGGLSIAMVGIDGVRYYGSHLSKIEAGIKPGVKVKGGEILGRTGKSGNARYTPSHLHFGISHPTTPDDWEVRRGEISPYKYLKAWQAGRSLRPDISP